VKKNNSAVMNKTETNKGGSIVDKLKGKFLLSRIVARPAANEKFKEFVVTVRTPGASTWGIEPGERVDVEEVEFVCYPTYTKDGPVWRARVSDVTKYPNGRFERSDDGSFVLDKEGNKKVEKYGLPCVALRMESMQNKIAALKMERDGIRAAVEFCPLTKEERERLEEVEAEIKGLHENSDPCNGCGNSDGCKNKWKSFICWPRVTLFDGASYKDMAELASSVASVVARVVDPRYPSNIKGSIYAGWNKCSSCKFSQYIHEGTDPEGIDPVTGVVTMEKGAEYRRQPGLCDDDIRNSRDPRAKRPNHFCVLHNKDVFDYDACTDYIYRTSPMLFASYSTDPAVRADNIVEEEFGRIIGTKAYAQFCTDKLPELKVIEVGEEKEKEPGHIPTAYKAGTFVVLFDELIKKEPNLMRALGTVNVCEQRKRDSDGKEFTYLSVMLLDDKTADPLFKDVKGVRKVPEELMAYVFANMETESDKVINKLRELLPSDVLTEEEVERRRREAVMGLPTYVRLDLDNDFSEKELAITKPGLYTTMVNSPWKVADVFILSKSGKRIKGLVKRQKTGSEVKYTFDLVSGFLTREEFALTMKAALLRVSENLKVTR
jgi:hypothetical protein